MLRNKYRAFEIRDDQVSQTLVDGNLCSIAELSGIAMREASSPRTPWRASRF